MNSLLPIFDGNQTQYLPVDQFDTVVSLDSITNGLQFSPQTSSDSIKAFDNFYQRHFEFSYDRNDKIEGP